MEWISVDEKLPEFGQKVLCYQYPKHPIMEGIMIAINDRVDLHEKHSWRSNLDKNKFKLCSEVTHWMPLPEPPKS